MIITTKFFGELEINDDGIFTFEDGIPGFIKLHKYIVIKEDNVPFTYLQSVEDEEVCFIMVEPHLIIEDYDVEVSDSTVSKLGIEKPEDILLYSILTIPGEAKDITANLKAPVLINSVNKKGIQEIIDDERYSTRYKISKEGDA